MRMPHRSPALFLPVILLVSALVFHGCGGGGEAAPAAGPAPVSKVLSWDPPQSFADQTPLDPSRDLAHYEIYVNESGNFSSADQTDATVSAVDPAGGRLVTSFDIANLGAFLTPNVKYYISMKSVSVTGVKSDFSPAVSFTL